MIDARAPSSPSACDAILRRSACASDTAVWISSSLKCWSSRLSRSDIVPPEVQILTTSAPSRTDWRTAFLMLSGPSTTKAIDEHPHSHSDGRLCTSPWPQVMLNPK